MEATMRKTHWIGAAGVLVALGIGWAASSVSARTLPGVAAVLLAPSATNQGCARAASADTFGNQCSALYQVGIALPSDLAGAKTVTVWGWSGTGTSDTRCASQSNATNLLQYARSPFVSRGAAGGLGSMTSTINLPVGGMLSVHCMVDGRGTGSDGGGLSMVDWNP
jgi:hypothetical protein